jgi:hypothetical protein
VPLLFYVFELLDKMHKSLKFILMSLIAATSFGIQSSLDGDAAHMLLPSRLWQFMAGFATFHLYEKKWLNIENLLEFPGNHEMVEKGEKPAGKFL